MCFFAMLMNISPTLFTPTYLQEIIKINKENAGAINASLSVIVEVTIICFIGSVGLLSDKKGRKPLLVAGFFLTGIFTLLYGSSHIISGYIGLSKPIFLVYFFRFLLGASLLFVWPQVQNMLTDYTYVEGRGKAMAILGFMFTFASLFCFIVIAQLPKIIGLYNVFILIAVIGILSSIVSSKTLVDMVQVKEREKIQWKRVLKIFKKSSCLKITYAVAFAARSDSIILATFVMVWVNKVAAEYGKTPFEAMAQGGITVGIASIIGLLLYPLWGYLADKVGRLQILLFGAFFSGLGYVLIFFIDNPFSIWMKICVILFGIGFNGCSVGATTLTSDVAPRDMIGSVLGGYHTIAAMGIIFFLQIGGFLFDKISHSSPFVLTGTADLVVAFLILILWKKAVKEQEMLKESDH
ncbi:MAG: MFS transporter [Candidatus Schekmanbacteria bacterium]|nr:MAG: MFS transporter [Candidatus Schekmanbacteria bacterium]